MTSPVGLEGEVLSAIRRVIRAVDLHSRKLHERCGLTGPQLVALHEVVRLENASAGALARAINLSQSTVTGILDRLEKRQLISRERSGTDRRTVTVSITPTGLAVLEKAPSLLQERFCNEFQKLEEWEQTQMLATLQRLASMMQIEELEAAPVLVPGAVVAPGQEETEPSQPVMDRLMEGSSKQD